MQDLMKIAVYLSAVAFIVFPVLLLQILKQITRQRSVIFITILLIISACLMVSLLYVRFMVLAYSGERSRNWLLTFYGMSALLIISPMILIHGAKRILDKDSIPELFFHNFYLGVTGLFCWLVLLID